VTAAKHSDRKTPELTQAEPGLRAAPFLEAGSIGAAPVLTERQRQQLLEIATRVRVPARSVVYREQTAATWIFINTEGVLKTFKDLRSGRRWVTRSRTARWCRPAGSTPERAVKVRPASWSPRG